MQEERMHEQEHMILSFVEDEHYRPMKIKRNGSTYECSEETERRIS